MIRRCTTSISSMKSTLAFILILLAFQLEWTHPRAFQANAADGIRYIECTPCAFTDPNHPHAPPGRCPHDTPVNDGVLEKNDNDDDLTCSHLNLVDVSEWARIDLWSRCGSRIRRQPSAGLRPATVGATLRC